LLFFSLASELLLGIADRFRLLILFVKQNKNISTYKYVL